MALEREKALKEEQLKKIAAEKAIADQKTGAEVEQVQKLMNEMREREK